jgi:hypothetical protein
MSVKRVLKFSSVFDLYFGTSSAVCPICHSKKCEYQYDVGTYDECNCEPICVYECNDCLTHFECVSELEDWELPSYW